MASRELGDYRFCNHLRPHPALGARTPAELLQRAQEAEEEEPHSRRCLSALTSE